MKVSSRPGTSRDREPNGIPWTFNNASSPATTTCLGHLIQIHSLHPDPSQVGSKVGAVLTSPFPTPSTTNAACGFPALRFLCYFHLKVYETYQTGSTFKPGSNELYNHCTILELHTTKSYSTCSSRSHGVFWHTSDVV